jgi:hypothetical protein
MHEVKTDGSERKMDEPTITAGDYRTPLSAIDGSNRQKITKRYLLEQQDLMTFLECFLYHQENPHSSQAQTEHLTTDCILGIKHTWVSQFFIIPTNT